MLKNQKLPTKKRVGTPLKINKDALEDSENRAALEDLNREIQALRE